MHKITHADCVWGTGLWLGDLQEKEKVLQNYSCDSADGTLPSK